MNWKKYLPIGTVLMLKGGSKRVMITGFVCNNQEDRKVYDYSGCLYPEGILSSNNTLLFNHDQIEKVDYLGYSDEEEKEFKKKLNDLLNK
jgi:hypothetical protein